MDGDEDFVEVKDVEVMILLLVMEEKNKEEEAVEETGNVIGMGKSGRIR